MVTWFGDQQEREAPRYRHNESIPELRKGFSTQQCTRHRNVEIRAKPMFAIISRVRHGVKQTVRKGKAIPCF